MSFSYKGRQIRRSTEVDDKKLAESIYYKVRTQIKEGKWFEIPPDADKTFKDMMDRYMEEHSIPKKASSGRDKTSLKRLLPFFGNYTLLQITPKLINEYKNKRRVEGISTGSINRELALMKHAFNLACREWEWIRDNPVKRVSMEKEPPSRDRWLRYDEEERLLLQSPVWLQEVIIFAVETGCRQGEMLSLAWRDVDLFKRIVTIFGKKTGGKRTIPLSTRAFELLKEKGKVRMLKGDIVFCFNGGKINQNTLSSAFKKARREANIEGFRFHDLRHTFATRMAQAGVDPYTIQRLLGHRTASMTQRYAHHSIDSLRRGFDVFEKVREEEKREGLSQNYHNFITVDSKTHGTFNPQKLTTH